MSKEHKSTIKQQVMIKTIKSLGNKYTKNSETFDPETYTSVK